MVTGYSIVSTWFSIPLRRSRAVNAKNGEERSRSRRPVSRDTRTSLCVAPAFDLPATSGGRSRTSLCSAAFVHPVHHSRESQDKTQNTNPLLEPESADVCRPAS